MSSFVLRPTRVAIAAIALVTSSCTDLTRPTASDLSNGRRGVPPSARLQGSLDVTELRPIFGPQSIVRATGAPVWVSFTLAGYGPSAILHVVNGDVNGANRATSGDITVDGTGIVSPSSFSKNVASFDAPFTLGNPSTLSVRLAGAPGSMISISIDAQLSTAATVGATGGAVQLLGTQAVLDIPPGAVGGTLTISAAPVTPDPGNPANASVTGGSTINFGPDGTQFSQPITIALTYDPAKLPPRFNEAALRLGTLVNGRWVEVKGSSVNASTHTITGQTTHFSTYGVVAFETFTQITIGLDHTCGLTPGQDVYCWGENDVGQLGSVSTSTCLFPNTTATRPCSPTPALVDGGLKFSSVSAGGNTTCGVTVAGDAYCWGGGANGRIGDGGQSNRAAPTLVSGGLQWGSVSVGNTANCGLTTAAQAYCWGSNNNGALGAPASEMCGTVQCATTPLAVATPLSFLEISSGLVNACALATDHTAWCWGWGMYDVIGDGTTINRPTPVAVAGGLLFTHISSGGLSSCGVTANHTGYCWGNNTTFSPVLGTGVAANSSTPIAVSGGLSFDILLANEANNISEHNCGLTTAGEAWCWGGNSAQQLGSTVSDKTCGGNSLNWACMTVPVNAVPGQTFRGIAVGNELTCVQGMDGQAYCFGNDTFGQIGDGTVSTSRSFTRVPRP